MDGEDSAKTQDMDIQAVADLGFFNRGSQVPRIEAP